MLKVLTVCLLAGATVCAGIVVYFMTTTDPIDAENIYSHIEMSSVIYDSKGNEIDKLHYLEDREIVPISDIPAVTRNAFIAVEDKTFYRHHGFNLKRMLGAVFDKAIGRSSKISGTSTITQQLARNVFLADSKSERTLKRKAREMLYALQIERTLSKDEILEAYLNTIYLGYGCYGIDAAARTYFSKPASELDLAESVALAALPQAPDAYALLQNEEGEDGIYLKSCGLYANDSAKERRELILSLMAEQGYITDEEASEAMVDIEDLLDPDVEKASSEYTYFTDYVSDQVVADLVKQYDMTEDAAEYLVYTGGLQIHTTIEPEMQKVINAEFSNDYNFPWSTEEPQAAMVITEVNTGRILAMSGGRKTKGKKLFNRAVSPRQPGSSIKPLSVYSAALQKSYECEKEGKKFPLTDYKVDRQGISGWGDYITAGSRVTDEKMIVNGQVWPLNFSRYYSGYKTFRTALQQSINTCAVKIQLQVGSEYSVEMLHKYGISTVVDDISLPTNDINPAAMALGAMTYGVKPLDMALAYGTFPAGGKRYEARCYDKVLSHDGKVLLDGAPKGVNVLDEGVAFIMTDVLKSVVSRGIARDASIYGVEVGGKTGTTNDTYDIWFCGFTPKYSAALWIGTDHNTQMSGTSSQAAALWSAIMRQVPGVTDGEYPSQPSDVVERSGEYFTEGTAPAYIPPAVQPKRRKSTSSSGNNNNNNSGNNGNRNRNNNNSGGGNHSGSSGTVHDQSVEDWYQNWLDNN